MIRLILLALFLGACDAYFACQTQAEVIGWATSPAMCSGGKLTIEKLGGGNVLAVCDCNPPKAVK